MTSSIWINAGIDDVWQAITEEQSLSKCMRQARHGTSQNWQRGRR